jgi:hypothetical protein
MFRLYLDESGDHAYSQLQARDKRYLSVVGCVFDLVIYRQVFQPGLEQLKARFFPHDPDEPVILHRKELINKRGPFRVLLDPQVRNSFDRELLALVSSTDFRVIAVVLDKRSHIERYAEAAWHPYHYCLAVVLERYCGYLINVVRGEGDLVAESRGRTEDSQLKAEYDRIYRNGTRHRSAHWFQAALTTHEIKLKPKSKNIAGLQLADLLAHPVKQEILAERGRLNAMPEGFARELCQTLAGKYDRHVQTGTVWGYGKKLLD